MHLTIKDTTMNVAVRNFNVGKVNCNDLSKVIDFLEKHYFPHALLWKYANLQNDPIVLENLKKFWKIALSQNISVVITNESEEIVGFSCNIIKHKQIDIDYGLDGEIQTIRKFLNEMGKEIYKKYEDLENYFYIVFLAVREDCSHLGLQKRLVNYSRNVAADLGVKIIRLDTQSMVTAKLAKKLRFKLVHEIKYNEYEDGEEKIFSEDCEDVFSIFTINSKRGLFNCFQL